MNHVITFYAESRKHHLRLKYKKLLAVMIFNSRHSICFIRPQSLSAGSIDQG
jgi:hypothetical protein